MRSAIFAGVIFTFLLHAGAAECQFKTRDDRLRELADYMAKAKVCPTEEKLRNFGSDADSMMTNICTDRNRPLELRLLAVDCLAYFSNKRSSQVLHSMLTDPTWDRPFQHKAMMSLAKAFGEEVFPELKTYTESQDPATRLQAVKALGLIGGERVKAYLQSLAQREQDSAVLQAISDVCR